MIDLLIFSLFYLIYFLSFPQTNRASPATILDELAYSFGAFALVGLGSNAPVSAPTFSFILYSLLIYFFLLYSERCGACGPARPAVDRFGLGQLGDPGTVQPPLRQHPVRPIGRYLIYSRTINNNRP
jgi:hypothetical protein